MFRRNKATRGAEASENNEKTGNGLVSTASQPEQSDQITTDGITQPKEAHHHYHHPHMPEHLPFHNPHPKTKGIKHEGESGRSGIHPLKFLYICMRSSCTMSMIVNVLWPLVPAAIAVNFALEDNVEHGVLKFTLNYLAIIPSANLIGFAGQELARKLPTVYGVVLENFLGSIVEIIIFVALVAFAASGTVTSGFVVVKAAILGSILANLLFALGLCFIAGGIRHAEQSFHEVVSEVGSGLMLVAGFALIIPAAFATAYPDATVLPTGTIDGIAESPILSISRGTCVLLLIAFATFLFFQVTSHHSVYDQVLEADELMDKDRHRDLMKAKLTFTEAIVALVIGIACAALTAIFLVKEIDHVVEMSQGRVSESFMGLILVPLVEKVAEHLTAADEAWDNQPNFALLHVLGSCIHTALFNTPVAVFVAWTISQPLDLNFRPFEAIVLILAIIVVGNFLRDGKSNYLEGALCVITYVIIALCAFYYPNEVQNGAEATSTGEAGGSTGESGGEATSSEAAAAVITEAARLMVRTVLG